jgi:MSHA pilin protein MshA
MKKCAGERGFTLIELIVVIVILGIVAVIAVPKYQDLIADAEKGTATGVTAALRGAVAIRHARFLLDNTNDYDATTIAGDLDLEGLSVAAAAAGDELTLTFSDSTNTYTWTYTDRSGNTPGKLTESW